MKIGTIQSMACVGLGALLGAVAATRDITPSSRANAPRRGPTGSAGDRSDRPGGQPAHSALRGYRPGSVAGPGRC